MGVSEVKEAILNGKTTLGIEFGSTRIKAVLIGEDNAPIAAGNHEWENRYENNIWTYSLEDIWGGLQDSYRKMAEDVKEKYEVTLTKVGALGFSAMMHGYMAFNEAGELMVPFRTWRNTITEEASVKLTELFEFNIPQRWSIAHLYQAILNKEEHVKDISYLTTLEGYVHWKLTGKKVLGIGEAAGMGAHRRRLARTTIRRNASRCVEGNDIRLSWHGSSLVLSLPGFVSGAGSQSKAGRLSVRRRGAPCSQVEATDERAPFLEGGIADGVFHLAGLDFRHLGLDPQGLGQKVEEHAMAVEHRPTVGVARLGQRDVAVVRLHDQLLLLQSGDGLVHRRFGNAQLVGHIHRAHGRVGRAAQHDDGLEVILVRHGRFHHSNLLIEQVRSS